MTKCIIATKVWVNSATDGVFVSDTRMVVRGCNLKYRIRNVCKECV